MGGRDIPAWRRSGQRRGGLESRTRGGVELILCGWHICRAEFARITKTSVAGKTNPQSGLIRPRSVCAWRCISLERKVAANGKRNSRGRGRQGRIQRLVHAGPITPREIHRPSSLTKARASTEHNKFQCFFPSPPPFIIII